MQYNTATYFIQALQNSFISHFKQQPLLVQSPGRINLLGEHTDYNDGYVLPASIDRYIYVAVAKRNDDAIHLHAIEFKESCSTVLSSLRNPLPAWSAYVLGVVEQLQKRNYSLQGFNLIVHGNVPTGAGMSSSAALECAVVFALNELFALNISKLEMVQIAQKAEQEFVGLQCGIMDMFASMFGKNNNLIKLDCRSLAYEYIPFKHGEIKIVLFNSNVKHSLASSAYNERRKQCESGVAMIQQKFPHVASLRDANMNMLNAAVPANDIVYKRCRYVIEENERLLSACIALNQNDITAFGKKMFETHAGLSELYEVSCAELDFLIALVRNNNAVIGARMMGGGFGGCTINLIKESAVEATIKQVTEAYTNHTGKAPGVYIASIENGTARII